ncbi:lysozyme inhibitor LprI family protein [Superficieibacter sp.]|uniref:lysozyme inhibitor LprI family protein n=1 Tax=Superficieibacter sp. TaxID=2303322 RepID=UPI0028B04C10|nr:lysozyme inhibitor LprI family protein [Superficieibacter sp.]
MKKTTLLMAAMLISAPAFADECGDASTQAAMNQCSAAQYQAADKKLNETWNTALKRAEEPQKELLKKAQQKWIALRDADCELIASGTEGGSVQPLIHNQCLTEKTEERNAWLGSMLQCEEGDLSCPLPPAR